MGQSSSIERSFSSTDITQFESIFHATASGRDPKDKKRKLMTKLDFKKQFPCASSRDLFGHEFFSVFDLDDSGEIDFEEFFIGVTIFLNNQFPRKLDALYRLLDRNQDASLEADELADFLSRAVAKGVMMDVEGAASYTPDKLLHEAVAFDEEERQREASGIVTSPSSRREKKEKKVVISDHVEEGDTLQMFRKPEKKSPSSENPDSEKPDSEKPDSGVSVSNLRMSERVFKAWVEQQPFLRAVVERVFTLNVVQQICDETRGQFQNNIDVEIISHLPMEEHVLVEKYTFIRDFWLEVLFRRLYAEDAVIALAQANEEKKKDKNGKEKDSKELERDREKRRAATDASARASVPDGWLGKLYRLSSSLSPQQLSSEHLLWTDADTEKARLQLSDQRRILTVTADLEYTLLFNRLSTLLETNKLASRAKCTSLLQSIDARLHKEHVDVYVREMIEAKREGSEAVMRHRESMDGNRELTHRQYLMTVDLDTDLGEMQKNGTGAGIGTSKEVSGKGDKDNTNGNSGNDGRKTSTTSLKSGDKKNQENTPPQPEISKPGKTENSQTSPSSPEQSSIPSRDEKDDAGFTSMFRKKKRKDSRSVLGTESSEVGAEKATGESSSSSSSLATPSKTGASTSASTSASKDAQDAQRRRSSVDTTSILAPSPPPQSPIVVMPTKGVDNSDKRVDNVNNKSVDSFDELSSPVSTTQRRYSFSVSLTPYPTADIPVSLPVPELSHDVTVENLIPKLLTAFKQEITLNYIPFAVGPEKSSVLFDYVHTTLTDYITILTDPLKYYTVRRVRAELHKKYNKDLDMVYARLNDVIEQNQALKQVLTNQENVISSQTTTINGLLLEHDNLKEEAATLRKQNELLKDDMNHIICVKELALSTLRDEVQFYEKENMTWSDRLAQLHTRNQDLMRQNELQQIEITHLRSKGVPSCCTIM